MTILVTGAAGYIGSATVHGLYRKHKVIGLDNLSTGKTCPLPAGFDCFHGEVGSRAFVGNLIDRYKVKQIVHCAAKVVAPESVDKPVEYYRNNAIDTMTLYEVAAKHRVQGFVFASTAAVYGSPDLIDRPLREDDPCRPCSPYGWSKLMAEQYMRDVHEVTGMNTVILRYFNVAGADPAGAYGPCTEYGSHLIPRVVRAALGLMPKVLVYGDGADRRDYVHVEDVARANRLALKWTEHDAGLLTLNVGTTVGFSAMNVIDCVQKTLGVKVPWDYAQRREGDPASIVASTKLITERFDWRPQYALKQIVEHAAQWEQTKLPPQ